MHQIPIVLLDKINIFPCQICSRAFLRKNEMEKHEAELNHVNQDVRKCNASDFKHLPEYDKYWEKTRISDAKIDNKPIIEKSKNLKQEIKLDDIFFNEDNSCIEPDHAKKPKQIVKKKKQIEDTEFRIKQQHEETFLEFDIKPKTTIIPNSPVKQELKEVTKNDKSNLIKNFDEIYTCGQCPKSFKTLKSMTNHLAKHCDPSHQCIKCQKSFHTLVQLNRHMSRSHSIRRGIYCNICRREFKHKQNLEIHLRTHTGERPFPCEQCGKRFTQTAALYTHKKTHSGVKEHICPYCNKGFTDYHNMKKHERTHTKERPHDCKYCGKAFGDPSALIRHVRTHTGAKIYHCQVCPMKFSDASGLIAHRKRHDGKKNFACELCPKKFLFRTNLANHITCEHTTIRNFECDLCNKKFALKQYLRGHIERQHF